MPRLLLRTSSSVVDRISQMSAESGTACTQALSEAPDLPETSVVTDSNTCSPDVSKKGIKVFLGPAGL